MSDPNFYPKGQLDPYRTASDPATPDGATKAMGIFCADIILRTAIMSAFAEFRANPTLLDYAFANFPQDGVTANEYGVKEKDNGKKWFLDNEVHVLMNYNFAQNPKFPCITIALLESTEENNTLGDVHYDTTDKIAGNSISSVLGPLTVVSYDAPSGKMVIQNPNNVPLTTNLLILDTTSNLSYKIINLDDYFTIYITPNTQLKLDKLHLVPQDQFYRVALESLTARETYRIGCHIVGQPVYLHYLYTVFMLALLWGREKYLESRGIERSRFSSSDFAPEATVNGNEIMYSRYTNLTGYVRHYWPKSFSLPISGISGENIKIISGVQSPEAVNLNQGWMMDLDKPPF